MPLREGEKLIAAAFAPDLTKVVVQQGGNVTLHQPTGQVWDLEVSPALILPGPLAWTEDGSGIATTRLTPFTAFSVLDAGTGRPSADIAQQSGLNYLSPQGRSDGLPAVLGWHDGVPIVNAANRSIVHLNVPYNVLATAAEGTRELQLASIGTDWQAIDPGTPDPGPALQRYRPVVSVALPGLLVVVVLVGVLVMFLLPWLRPRRRA
jgi:hypothetical protein